MRNVTLMVIAALAAVGAAPCFAEEPDHRVVRGETLWDLSDRYWSDPWTWPELWALNPHFRNPHIIFPGDPIFLDRGPAKSAVQEEDRVVRLPWEKLEPPSSEGDGAQAAADQAPEIEEPKGPPKVLLSHEQGQDFLVQAPVDRWATVHNRHQIKVAYTEGEDVEFDLASGGEALQPGDLVTLFDDSEPVVHPVTGAFQGYYVEVLGHMEVLAVHEGRGVGRLLETYDAVEDGAGLMAYRPPVRELELQKGPDAVDGMILRGKPGQSIFSTDDLVLLDRGGEAGLAPGALLEIPVTEGSRNAQGMVDLGTPLAVLLVVASEGSTSTGIVLESRAAVEAGDRFVGSPFSP